MIRINLLGVAKPKKRAGVPVSMPIKAPSPLMVAGLVAVLAAGGNYFWYWTLQREAASLQQQIKAEEEKNRRLAEVRTAYLELEKQKNQYEHRVNVINELAKRRKGPADLLNTIAETVNRTDAVWLNTMREEGENVNLEGVALSVNAVARLMQNLRNTGQFRSVEIQETFQDDGVKDMQAFVFHLILQKQPPLAQS